MSNLDALKTQVDEMKERLGTSDAQRDSEAGEFKTLLASIKTNLQTKQAEIERLTAENEQLRKMLSDALATVGEHQVQATGNVLRDLHTELAALVEQIGADGPENVPDEAASPSEPDRASEASRDQPEPTAGPAPAASAATDDSADDADDDVEDSPALRRIMHRGRGGK